MFGKNDDIQSRNFLNNIQYKLISQKDNILFFLLLGRTGVGKSSTINSLMGKEVANVGDYEPTTMEIKQYESELNGIKFTVIDTPGLCDDLEEFEKDYSHLELIRSNVEKIDSMWFVSELHATRVTSDEKRGIKLISQSLTPEIWNRAVIIFTFAGQVDSSKYAYTLSKRTELIRKEIAQYTGDEVAKNIPSVAVDNKSATTPDGQKWLGELFTQVYARISDKGMTPFLLSVVDRIKPPKKEKEIVYVPKPVTGLAAVEQFLKMSTGGDIELNERQIEIIRKKTAAAWGITGAAIGAVIGSGAGPLGTIIGGAIGGGGGLLLGKAAEFLKGVFGK